MRRPRIPIIVRLRPLQLPRWWRPAPALRRAVRDRMEAQRHLSSEMAHSRMISDLF
ncbi:MAG: hypothetical protein AAF467_06055 [Actinomycetota bacterium]